MDKEQISKSYIDQLKIEHGAKIAPQKRHIAITGAGKEDSIGITIARNSKYFINILSVDVTGDTIDHFDRYTDLIMCHGYTYMDWLENMSDPNIDQIIAVNLYGSIRMIKQFVQQTINKPYRKKIITIGSMAYNHVLNGSSVYCASKAGLNHFIKCAAWELAPKGYDVYIIHPSNVLNTPMTEETIQGLMRYRQLSREDAEAYWGASLPKNSFLTKEEIAQHVDYLLGDNTEYLSGCPIELTGGQR